MLSETASVVSLDAETIQLKTQRLATCTGCSLKSGCGQYLLSRDQELLNLSGSALVGKNPISTYRTGDRVQLTMEPEQLLVLTAWFYMLPLVFLLVATVIATLSGLSDAQTALAALTGLATGLWCSNKALKHHKSGVCLQLLSGSDAAQIPIESSQTAVTAATTVGSEK